MLVWKTQYSKFTERPISSVRQLGAENFYQAMDRNVINSNTISFNKVCSFGTLVSHEKSDAEVVKFGSTNLNGIGHS
jgi:hypothetical protein